jgi:hypothetical protein
VRRPRSPTGDQFSVENETVRPSMPSFRRIAQALLQSVLCLCPSFRAVPGARPAAISVGDDGDITGRPPDVVLHSGTGLLLVVGDLARRQWCSRFALRHARMTASVGVMSG